MCALRKVKNKGCLVSGCTLKATIKRFKFVLLPKALLVLPVGLLVFYNDHLTAMEDASNQLSPKPNLQVAAKQRIEAAATAARQQSSELL